MVFTFTIVNNVITAASGSGEAIIPDTVIGINDGVFYANGQITQLVIPDNSQLQYIGTQTEIASSGAFESSTVTSVTIGSNSVLSYLGGRSFFRCYGLTSFTIPNTVTSINTWAFNSCSALAKTIIIPDATTYVGTGPFQGTNINNVTFNSTYISMGAFDAQGITSVTIYPTSTAIRYRCFYNCTILPSASIPSSVTYIGNESFYNCFLLTSVGNSLGNINYIGTSAFLACSLLSSFSIPSTVTTIGNNAFYNCSSLTQPVTIPDATTSVGGAAFYNTGIRNVTLKTNFVSIYLASFTVANITSVTISSDSTSICDQCFRNCANVPSISIPASVTYIGDQAFRGCAALSSVTLPTILRFIGGTAFYDCTSLKEITIPDATTSVGGSCFYNSGIVNATFCGNFILPNQVFPYANFTSITLSEATTVLPGESYLSNANNLISIRIPDSVTTLNNNVMQNCAKLTNIIINSHTSRLRNLPFFGFSGNTKLTSFTYPDSLVSIDRGVLDGCTSLKTITCKTNAQLGNGASYLANVPNVIISNASNLIAGSMFLNYTLITSVTFESPCQVTTIGGSAFQGCSALTLFSFPDSITSIQGSAFYNCNKMTPIVLTNNIRSIGQWTFRNTAISSIIFPNSVTTFGENAILGCINLTSVTINSNYSLRSIVDQFGTPSRITNVIIQPQSKTVCNGFCQAFSNLQSIDIPNQVTSLQAYSFDGCTNLTSATMYNGVTLISGYAFRNCTKLVTFTIPDSVTAMGTDAFGNVKNLTLSTNYPSSLGNWLVAFGLITVTSVTISPASTKISSLLFYALTNLRDITIPSGVTYVGDRAFNGCTMLSSVIFSEEGVRYIDYDAFINCTSLKSVTLPNTLTATGQSVFNNCSSMTSITLQPSLTSVGEGLCNSCTSLNTLIINGLSTFNNPTNCFQSAPVKNLTYDSNFYTNINTQIGINKSNLTSITLIGGTTSITANAFSGLTNLQDFSIPSTVTNIGSLAFSNCSTLTSFSISSGATFASDAFSGTTNIATLGINPGLLSVTSIPIALSNVTTLDVVQNTTTIPSNSLAALTGLKTTVIANSVTSIGSTVFLNSTGLTSLTIEGGPTIDSNAFTGNPVTDLGFNTDLLPSLTLVPLDSTILSSITVLDGSTTVSNATFSNLNITSVTLPSSLTSIGSDSFSDCQNLTNIILPDNLDFIGAGSFQNTPSLEIDFVVPPNIDIINESTFENSGVTSITIDETSLSFGYDSEEPIFLRVGATNKKISIGKRAFANAIKVKKFIYVQRGFYSLVNDEALSNDEILNFKVDNLVNNDQLSNLKMVGSNDIIKFKTVGLDETFIDDEAFLNCSSLTEYTIPSSTTYIGKNAFENCSSLPEIIIPASVAIIDLNAFLSCTALSSVILECTGTFTDMKQDSFQNTTSIVPGSQTIVDLLDPLIHGYTVQALNFAGFNTGMVCFKEDSKILCLVDGVEKEVFVQDLRKGVLVKTLLSGYVPVYMIGTSKIYNSGNLDRIKDRLYLCSKEKYPELNEDLVITGGHSILVDKFVGNQLEQTKKQCDGRFFLTEKKIRLMAYLDDRATPYNKEGEYNIYHFALENEEYFHNYGVYANGLLVETCSKRYLTELSNMKFL
jgi:hypothetical protein